MRGQELGQGKTQIQSNHTVSRRCFKIAAAAECRETSRRTLQKDQQSMNLTRVGRGKVEVKDKDLTRLGGSGEGSYEQRFKKKNECREI